VAYARTALASALLALSLTAPTGIAAAAATPAKSNTATLAPTIHFAEVSGRKVFYREAGPATAPTIVLLHGFPTSSHMFRDLIPLLAGQFHVIAPDYIGFGYSDAPPVTEFNYTFDNLTAHVQGLLDQLHVSNYILYMQDYGGPIGFRIAAAHPERVKGLVIQNTNAYLEGVSETVANVFKPLWQERNAQTEGNARAFLKPETTKFQYTAGAHDANAISPDAWTMDQALLDRPGNDLIQLALFSDYKTNVGLYDAWHSYFKAHQPKTLITWGKGDPLFVPAGAEAYKKDLPKAELVWLDGSHFALEEHATEIASAIKHTFATKK